MYIGRHESILMSAGHSFVVFLVSTDLGCHVVEYKLAV